MLLYRLRLISEVKNSMPFNEINKEYVVKYCNNHLPSEEWFEENFDFIKDNVLRERLVTEFKNVRFMYKLFEGISAKDELLLAEVRLQILMYASIYEAVIHYLLFEVFKDWEEVKILTVHIIPKKISIPAAKLQRIEKELEHDGKEIVPFFYSVCKKEITAIRFDDKCKVAEQIGLIDSSLCNELIKIYEIRNGLHMHAEIRKQIEYELETSRIAYRRMKLFVEQIKIKLKEQKKNVSAI